MVPDDADRSAQTPGVEYTSLNTSVFKSSVEANGSEKDDIAEEEGESWVRSKDEMKKKRLGIHKNPSHVPASRWGGNIRSHRSTPHRCRHTILI